MALVWAYKKLALLNWATGFVTTDDETARNLIASGDAQDPRIGASALKYVEGAPVEVATEYATKVMTAEKPPKKAKQAAGAKHESADKD